MGRTSEIASDWNMISTSVSVHSFPISLLSENLSRSIPTLLIKWDISAVSFSRDPARSGITAIASTSMLTSVSGFVIGYDSVLSESDVVITVKLARF